MVMVCQSIPAHNGNEWISLVMIISVININCIFSFTNLTNRKLKSILLHGIYR
jgi:hypothetical protein